MRIVKVITGLVGLGALLVSIPIVIGGVGLFSWAAGDADTELPTVKVVSADERAIVVDTDLSHEHRDDAFRVVGLPDVTFRATDGNEVFVGIGPEDDVDAFLLTDGTPGDQTFWIDASVGPDALLDWDVQPGDWSVVVMNADGTTGVDATVTASVPSGPLRVAGSIIALLGFGLGVIGVVLMVVGWGDHRAPDHRPVAPAAA
jgi:hypothetical protein